MCHDVVPRLIQVVKESSHNDVLVIGRCLGMLGHDPVPHGGSRGAAMKTVLLFGVDGTIDESPRLHVFTAPCLNFVTIDQNIFFQFLFER